MIEELGSYDPEVPLTDARCKLNNERIQYWLGVGAQPSDRVKVLIKKYGPGGTHLKQHEAAIAQLKAPKQVPDAGARCSCPNRRNRPKKPLPPRPKPRKRPPALSRRLRRSKT